jgi:outer membrane protein TolC
MGLQDSAELTLQYDTTYMEKEALTDTTLSVQYDNRIEYQLLQTQQRLQQANIKYYRSAYLPSIAAFGNYNLSYLNNNFIKTYDQGFANSNIGIQLAMPIFQGNKRVLQVRQAELQYKRLDWEMTLFKSKVNTQYTQALAIYKGNLYNYFTLKENVLLADDVYKTLGLQYKSGIRTYLDVIIAESDLRTTQLNFYNALFQLVQSKLDVQKALGIIQY